MRQMLPLHLVLLMSFPITVSAIIAIEDIFVTNQYLLVSHHQCTTQFEAGVKPGKCPLVYQKPLNISPKSCNPGDTKLHLIRDPTGKKPPKIAFVFYFQNKFHVNIEEINGTQHWPEETDRLNWSKVKERHSSGTHILRALSNEKFWSIFDTESQLLFLIQKLPRKDIPCVDVYFVSNLTTSGRTSMNLLYTGFTGSVEISGVKSFRIHRNIAKRFDWAEDAYTRKVYYKEINEENVTNLYSFPIEKMTKILIDGNSGDFVMKSDEKKHIMSMSAGAIIERNISGGNENTTVSTYIMPMNKTLTSVGILCQYTEVQSSSNLKLGSSLVIRDQDYCLLRFGTDTDGKCQKFKDIWLETNGLAEESRSDLIKWLTVTIIVLVMILILLMVYIYWLRSTFATEDERTHNEFENEASLFVAKQRSFPSQYPDPALLDVSVDKWN